MKNDWYTDFFSGLAVELWRSAMPAEVSAREAEFAARQLRLTPGCQVLDIGCGHGRHAVPLAQQGYRVTGVDISTEFLDAARQSAADANVDIRWIQADLYAEPNLPACDAIVWMGNGFAYADASRTQRLLTQLARQVSAGGRLLIDTGILAESVLRNLVESAQYELGEIRMTAERRYQPLLGCLDIVYTFSRAGQDETRSLRQWVFMLSQVRQLLESSGWRLMDVFSNPDGAPYMLGSEYAYLVSERIETDSRRAHLSKPN